jgi:RNA polymerase sigma-70 factor, ECF subfamily
MTSTIAPSIFAIQTICRLGWHFRQGDERIYMTPENSESKVASLVSSDDADTKLLLERVAKHDVKALSELYESHAGLLMSVIFAVLKDKSESEEILQECFLTIWNKAEMYQPHLGKPTSWMVTIAKNKAYDRYRKLVRQSDGQIILRDSMLIEPAATSVELDTDNERLHAGFKELNADQREAIEMVFFEGLTQQEVADKIDAPLGTVKARIRRGLLKLKEFLSNESQNIHSNLN